VRPAANVDVVVLGAGAAGMMCAFEAGKRGRSVVVIDHARAPGEKIRISGGGRCNFTNLDASPRNYLSANPGFPISALKRYTQHDFIRLVDARGIAWHEKARGQLFCDGSSRQIVDLLTDGLREAGAELRLATSVTGIGRTADGFALETTTGTLSCRSVVVATGGKSIPKMGATGFGCDIAEKFGLKLLPTRPALVPLTLEAGQLEKLAPLAGVAVEGRARLGKASFADGVLFTHRGLSGPAILQISSYWREGEEIALHIRPDVDFAAVIAAARKENGRQAVQTVLADHMPKKLAQLLVTELGIDGPLAEQPGRRIEALVQKLRDWRFRPPGSEGYRTAEVTLGGVDTAALDSRSMAAKAVPGLYFIGEAVDVTGWLGGYNFQWAWASGHAAGEDA